MSLGNRRFTISQGKLSLCACRGFLPGHKLDPTGVHPAQRKAKVIMNEPEPTNKLTVHAFLGIRAFYGRFLKHSATVSINLCNFLDRQVLAHYWRTSVVVSYESSRGVGAVLTQIDFEEAGSTYCIHLRDSETRGKSDCQLSKEWLLSPIQSVIPPVHLEPICDRNNESPTASRHICSKLASYTNLLTSRYPFVPSPDDIRLRTGTTPRPRSSECGRTPQTDFR